MWLNYSILINLIAWVKIHIIFYFPNKVHAYSIVCSLDVLNYLYEKKIHYNKWCFSLKIINICYFRNRFFIMDWMKIFCVIFISIINKIELLHKQIHLILYSNGNLISKTGGIIKFNFVKDYSVRIASLCEKI